MAFYKTPSKLKTSILAFIRNIVSKTYYKAFDIILSPCCGLSVTNISAECGSGTNLYNITVELAHGYSFPSQTIASMSLFDTVTEISHTATINYTNNATVLLFEDVPSSAATYIANVSLTMPVSTKTSGNTRNQTSIGISYSEEITLPSCS